MPRLVCLADTHTRHDLLSGPLAVPEGDILVFAGDACASGTPEEWEAFCRWLSGLPHRHKVVVAGNHDWPLQRARRDWGINARYGATTITTAHRRIQDAGAVLLETSGIEVAGVTLWGAPWVPAFNNWAFNLPRGGAQLREVWDRIPPGLDVLVTHAPAFGRLDRTRAGEHAGCELLAERLRQLDAEGAAPRLHVHGDIHEAAGVHAPPLGAECRITVNSAVLDEAYRLVRPPVVVEF